MKQFNNNRNFGYANQNEMIISTIQSLDYISTSSVLTQHSLKRKFQFFRGIVAFIATNIIAITVYYAISNSYQDSTGAFDEIYWKGAELFGTLMAVIFGVRKSYPRLNWSDVIAYTNNTIHMFEDVFYDKEVKLISFATYYQIPIDELNISENWHSYILRVKGIGVWSFRKKPFFKKEIQSIYTYNITSTELLYKHLQEEQKIWLESNKINVNPRLEVLNLFPPSDIKHFKIDTNVAKELAKVSPKKYLMFIIFVIFVIAVVIIAPAIS